MSEIRFTSSQLFSGLTGVVDSKNYVINGVSVITGGIEAEGHNLQIDDTTLVQLLECAKAKGRVPVNLDHGTGVKDLNGYLSSFRLDGNKIRADWHLLRSHDESMKMMERADVMPDCFGLSVAFKGPPKGVPIGGGKMAARCEKLLSVDCVTRPAANVGLFSSVDTQNNGMANENTVNEEGQPSIAELTSMLEEMRGQLAQQQDFNQQLVDHLNGESSNEPDLAQIAAMDDDQLAQLGLTRAEVQAAVDEWNAAIDASEAGETGEGEGEGEGTESSSPAGIEVGAAMTGSGTGGTGGELSALRTEVLNLKRKQQAVEFQAKVDAENFELSEIENKVLILAEQRDRAIALAEKLGAQNDALQLAIRTGTRPVVAGVDTGIRLFGANGNGELHEFQLRVKQIKEENKVSEGKAIQLASKENPGLHADWVQSLQTKNARVA